MLAKCRPATSRWQRRLPPRCFPVAHGCQVCAADRENVWRLTFILQRGHGESTTDLAWDGHAIIYENNELRAESQRFSDGEEMIVSDLDLERLAQDRMRSTSFNDAVADHRERFRAVRRIPFDFQLPRTQVPLTRAIERFPGLVGCSNATSTEVRM